jgi:Cu/Ag efflux protein CusF
MQKMGIAAAVAFALMFALAGVALAGETMGKIQAINPMTQEVLLDNGSNLAVDQDTKIMVEGKEGTLEDLKEGDQVKASFQEKDGKNLAIILDVSASRHGSTGAQGRMGSPGGSGYGSQGNSTSGG